MNRFYKTDFYLEQIKKINSIFHLPFLGSDIITGFAGETDEDFEITRKNLENSGLTQIHTFPYSIRKGTIGADMPNQVPDNIKQQRADIIKTLSKQKYTEFITKNIGTIQEVLIEKHRVKHTNNLKGRTRNYLPVQIISDSEDIYNSLQNVTLTKFENGNIYGEIN